jgi:hypothetical protein
MAALVWLSTLSQPAVAFAAEDNPPGPGDRLQQLERRINELAERQEQMMRRIGPTEERQPRPMPGMRGQQGRPMSDVPPNLEDGRRPWAARGMPAPGMSKAHQGLRGLIGLVLVAGLICNILLAVWIFTDIRKRGEGSGIFIALALVAGIPTAIIYSLVRIGDRKA